MDVICKKRDSCSALKCGHHDDHEHTHNCDRGCRNEWHFLATCISDEEMRKQRESEKKNYKPRSHSTNFFLGATD